MTASFNAMGSALYARMGTVVYTYTTNGTATAMGTLGFYDTLAPQASTPKPYLVFQHMTGADEYLFGAEAGQADEYMLKVISDRNYAAQAQGIYDQAHSVLQDAPLSIASNQLLRCRRTAPVKYQDTDHFWHVGGLYRIDTWGTA